jgi:hypothetical protein
MIRRRRNGYQIIVYAGIDRVTGRQRQITARPRASARPKGSRPGSGPRSRRISTPCSQGSRAAGHLAGLRQTSGKPISPYTQTTTGA